jgi:hypothetical protein
VRRVRPGPVAARGRRAAAQPRPAHLLPGAVLQRRQAACRQAGHVAQAQRPGRWPRRGGRPRPQRPLLPESVGGGGGEREGGGGGAAVVLQLLQLVLEAQPRRLLDLAPALAAAALGARLLLLLLRPLLHLLLRAAAAARGLGLVTPRRWRCCCWNLLAVPPLLLLPPGSSRRRASRLLRGAGRPGERPAAWRLLRLGRAPLGVAGAGFTRLTALCIR